MFLGSPPATCLSARQGWAGSPLDNGKANEPVNPQEYLKALKDILAEYEIKLDLPDSPQEASAGQVVEAWLAIEAKADQDSARIREGLRTVSLGRLILQLKADKAENFKKRLKRL